MHRFVLLMAAGQHHQAASTSRSLLSRYYDQIPDCGYGLATLRQEVGAAGLPRSPAPLGYGKGTSDGAAELVGRRSGWRGGEISATRDG